MDNNSSNNQTSAAANMILPPHGEAVENLAVAFATEEDNAAAWKVSRPKGKKNKGPQKKRTQPTAESSNSGTPDTQAKRAPEGKLTKSQKYRLKQKQRRLEAREAKLREPKPMAEEPKSNTPGPSFYFKARQNSKEPAPKSVAPPANSVDPSAVVAGSVGQDKECGAKLTSKTPKTVASKASSSAEPGVAADGVQTAKGYKYRHKSDNRFNRKKRAAIAISRSAKVPAQHEPTKRTRLDDTVSPRERKKQKLDSSRRAAISYSDIVSNELCVAVMREDGRQLSEAQATTVKEYLSSCILEDAMDPSKDFAPNFRGKPIIGDGALKLWCENAESLEWLRAALNRLPETAGPRLVVKKQSELTRRVRAALFLPECKTSVELTSLVLAKQNKWAMIPSWTVHTYTAQADGSLFLTLGIPETVVPILLKNERRLGHNLGNVYVRFFAADGSLQEEPRLTSREDAQPSAQAQPGPSCTQPATVATTNPPNTEREDTTAPAPTHSSPKPSSSRGPAEVMITDADPRTVDWRQVEEELGVTEDEDEGNQHDGDPDILDLL